MTAVKICGLTNLSDARWAWECGADLLGFIFVPSSRRYVTVSEVAPIAEALRREGCPARLVGVFAGEPAAAVRRIVAACGLDLAQLHGGESPEYIAELGLPAIVARPMTDGMSWAELNDYDAWAYLLDTHDPQQLGGTGRTWDWRRLDE
ncbi:MAG: phosphoribosylanthranilate isomerase, partial [Chloroflexi bacterium]|nr:phosphoribosylanthranilate isomerase [Chloroflexota bacterium]